MIEVTDLTFGYRPGAPIFAGFDWSADRGETWALVGPSGCGKTTLLYLLAGLRRPWAGSVWVDGQPVAGPRAATGLVLQDYGLLPWATARENVELGLRLRGVSARERRTAVDAWLERLGLAAVGGHFPGQLSGGQRQRVAIARTLALDPDLLLLDEPFAALDATTREELEELLLALAAVRGRTTVLVTHDIPQAVFLAERILVFGPAPIRGGALIENPEAGRPGWRREPAFFARCAAVRAALDLARLPPGSVVEPEAAVAERTGSRGDSAEVMGQHGLRGPLGGAGAPDGPTAMPSATPHPSLNERGAGSPAPPVARRWRTGGAREDGG